MGEIIFTLTPIIISSAVVPLQVMIIILLLNNPRQGLAKAVCLVAGNIAAWLTRYNCPIVMAVSLVFGLLFFVQGVSGLLQ